MSDHGKGHDNHGHDDHGHGHGPDPIQEHYELNERLQAYISEHKLRHQEAYVGAARKVFGTKGIKASDLQDPKKLEAFTNAITDSYISAVKKRLGIGKFKNDDALFNDENDLLYQATNFTKDELKNVIRANAEAGRVYDVDAHTEFTKEHVDSLNKRYTPVVVEPLLKEKHKGTFLKFMGLEDLVGTDKEPSHQEVVRDLRQYLSSARGQKAYTKAYKAGHGHDDHAHH